MHNEMSGSVIFKEEDDDGRERVTEEEKERVTIKASQQRSNFGNSQVQQYSKNFICKRKNLILSTLIDFEPV